MYIKRLVVSAFTLILVLALGLLVLVRANAADLDGDWLLEDLTCVELVSAYNYEREVLDQLITHWHDCNAYAASEADTGHGELHCALVKKEGEFVQGMVNDIAAVFNTKPECREAAP